MTRAPPQPMAQLLVLFVTAFVDMVGLAMIVPLLPYYATEFGASATVVGILVSAFSVAQLLVAPVWGRFSDRYGRRPAILAGLVVTALSQPRLFTRSDGVEASATYACTTPMVPPPRP